MSYPCEWGGGGVGIGLWRPCLADSLARLTSPPEKGKKISYCTLPLLERQRQMGALRLRLRLPSGQTTVEATTFGELADHVNTALGENSSSAWSLLTGYPPTLPGKV